MRLKPNAIDLRESDRRRSPAEWGAHLEGRAWDWWVTLTLDPGSDSSSTSEGQAVGEWRRFHKRLGGMAQRPVQYARVVQNVAGAHWHVHALLAECGDLSKSQIRGAWKGGIVNEVVRYDDTLRGALYMCRELDRFPD